MAAAAASAGGGAGADPQARLNATAPSSLLQRRSAKAPTAARLRVAAADSKWEDKEDADEQDESPRDAVLAAFCARERVIEGYLLKSVSRMGGWVRRYYVLNSLLRALVYYRDPLERFPSGFVPIDEFVRVDYEPERRTFSLVTLQRSWLFDAEAAADADEWVQALRRAVELRARLAAALALAPAPKTPPTPPFLTGLWRDVDLAPPDKGLSPLQQSFFRIANATRLALPKQAASMSDVDILLALLAVLMRALCDPRETIIHALQPLARTADRLQQSAPQAASAAAAGPGGNVAAGEAGSAAAAVAALIAGASASGSTARGTVAALPSTAAAVAAATTTGAVAPTVAALPPGSTLSAARRVSASLNDFRAVGGPHGHHRIHSLMAADRTVRARGSVISAAARSALATGAGAARAPPSSKPGAGGAPRHRPQQASVDLASIAASDASAASRRAAPLSAPSSARRPVATRAATTGVVERRALRRAEAPQPAGRRPQAHAALGQQQQQQQQQRRVGAAGGASGSSVQRLKLQWSRTAPPNSAASTATIAEETEADAEQTDTATDGTHAHVAAEDTGEEGDGTLSSGAASKSSSRRKLLRGGAAGSQDSLAAPAARSDGELSGEATEEEVAVAAGLQDEEADAAERPMRARLMGASARAAAGAAAVDAVSDSEMDSGSWRARARHRRRRRRRQRAGRNAVDPEDDEGSDDDEDDDIGGAAEEAGHEREGTPSVSGQRESNSADGEFETAAHVHDLKDAISLLRNTQRILRGGPPTLRPGEASSLRLQRSLSTMTPAEQSELYVTHWMLMGEGADAVCSVFLSKDPHAHNLALRVLFVLSHIKARVPMFKRRMQRQLASADIFTVGNSANSIGSFFFADYALQLVSGSAATLLSVSALVLLLITPVIDLNDPASLNRERVETFRQPVANPGVWRAIFSSLVHSEYHTRRRALKDVTALLIGSTQNCESLLQVRGWQKLLLALLTDIPADLSSRILEKVYHYVLNIFTLLHYHLFVHSENSEFAFVPVLFESMDVLGNGFRQRQQRVSHALLTALLSKLTATSKLFRNTYSGPVWENLMDLFNALKLYLFGSKSVDLLVSKVGQQDTPANGAGNGNTPRGGGASAVKRSLTSRSPKSASEQKKKGGGGGGRFTFDDSAVVGAAGSVLAPGQHYILDPVHRVSRQARQVHEALTGPHWSFTQLAESLERDQRLVEKVLLLLEALHLDRPKTADALGLLDKEEQANLRYVDKQIEFFRDAVVFLRVLASCAGYVNPPEALSLLHKLVITPESPERRKVFADFDAYLKHKAQVTRRAQQRPTDAEREAQLREAQKEIENRARESFRHFKLLSQLLSREPEAAGAGAGPAAQPAAVLPPSDSGWSMGAAAQADRDALLGRSRPPGDWDLDLPSLLDKSKRRKRRYAMCCEGCAPPSETGDVAAAAAAATENARRD